MPKKEERFILLENGVPVGDYLMYRSELVGYIEEVLSWEDAEDIAGRYEVPPFNEDDVKPVVIESEVRITF